MCQDILSIVFILLCLAGLIFQAGARRCPNPDVPDARDRLGWTTRWVRADDLSPRGARFMWSSYAAVLLAFVLVTLWPHLC